MEKMYLRLFLSMLLRFLHWARTVILPGDAGGRAVRL